MCRCIYNINTPPHAPNATHTTQDACIRLHGLGKLHMQVEECELSNLPTCPRSI